MTGPDNLCTITLAICFDGAVQPSYTTFLRPCAYGVMLDTKVVSPELRVHLNSDYLGDTDGSAHSTHFAEAHRELPVHTAWSTVDHQPRALNVRRAPSECLYDHLHRLLDMMEHVGRPTRIEVGDDALAPFEAVARGRSVASGRTEPARMRSEVANLLSTWGLLRPSSEWHPQA